MKFGYMRVYTSLVNVMCVIRSQNKNTLTTFHIVSVPFLSLKSEF